MLQKNKWILFFFLLFFCSYISAQVDSISVTDTVEISTEKTDETSEKQKQKYFLEKEDYSNAIDSLQLRMLPGSIVKKMQNDDDYWYANAEFKKKKIKPQDESHVPLGQRQWFQTLLWLLIIGGFAGFIIWYLASSNVSLFRKKAKRIDSGEQGVLETEDIFIINYQKEIDKAAQQKNYRLAVRLMFLRLLKNLSEKNIIQYNQVRTNLDYLMQLQPTRYYKDFFRITRNYEYSWYGEFEVSENAYHIIRNDFDNFDRQLYKS